MSKKPLKPRDARLKPTPEPVTAAAGNTHAVRETVESIVIAFVLAFLFRTFEAEAFVIPTGSMAPTLMGMHKDVACPKCSHRFRVGASEEGDDERAMAPLRPESLEVAAGVCPICRYLMPMGPNVPLLVADDEPVEKQRSYNGDRILVNKYLYTFTEPERFSVIVFHFPGNAEINYIKRLVGLPGETLRIFQGDLLVGPNGASRDEDFTIAPKPPDKVLAMRQLVHDTNYDPAELHEAGWPLRWFAFAPTGDDGWKTEKSTEDGLLRQRFTADRTSGGEAWLRYRHLVPNYEIWRDLAMLQQAAPPGQTAKFSDTDLARVRPELIMDFNAYNARLRGAELHNMKLILGQRLGLHWVGDLMLEADVEVAEAKGQLLLDLVEAGKHFTCQIDLANGKAVLGAEGSAEFAPAAATPIRAPGTYRVGFANVDDQMFLWVDGRLMTFDKSTMYNALEVFGGRNLRPHTSGPNRADLDLSPAGVGARDSKLTVTRLQIWRDIYYIADSWQHHVRDVPISDYGQYNDALLTARSDPRVWEDVFPHRRHVDFPLGEDQFFVMGDNSAESSDARLWKTDGGRGLPGGAYLERKLLIGKAVCVYWPHAWYTIPKTYIPVWPNFKDMRLVR